MVARTVPQADPGLHLKRHEIKIEIFPLKSIFGAPQAAAHYI
jgi:hypothetical protein